MVCGYLSTADSPTSGAVKEIIHDFAAKSLSITHDLALSTLKFCLILTFIIKALFMSAPMLRPLPCVPYFIKFFAPRGINTPIFNS